MSEIKQQRLFAGTEMAKPNPSGIDAGYWNALKDGEVRLQYCATCEEWIWGPRWMCGQCHSLDLIWKQVEAVGRVYSWARTWHSFIPEFRDEIPYVTVLVELPGADGRRVLGLLVDGPEEQVAVGDEVVGIIQHPDDSDWPVLRWRLVRPCFDVAPESDS